MDVLSLAGDARDFVAVGGAKSELDAYLRRALAGHRLGLEPEPSPQAGSYYRSDHFSLAKQGVPMLYAKMGNDLVEGGRAAGEAFQAAYRADRYHGPNDEYDPSWNWSGAIRELQIYWQIGRELATGAAWPNWNAGDEFRAVRDRSRGTASGTR
jgi:Zn-dependent M28 family amino/carboxypeptidase